MSPQPEYALQATTRTVTGKAVKQLRRDGKLPAVVYGHNRASLSLLLDTLTFAKLYREAGTSTLVDLTINSEKSVKVLIQEVKEHPIRRTPQHADFYVVNLKEKLRTSIGLTFTGTADAVEILEGSINHVKDEVEVECYPQDLVAEILVDISSLKTFDDVIRISDLTLPKGIEILDEAEEVIASVTEPRSEADMAELDTAIQAPEVVAETTDGTTAPGAEPDTEKKD